MQVFRTRPFLLLALLGGALASPAQPSPPQAQEDGDHGHWGFRTPRGYVRPGPTLVGLARPQPTGTSQEDGDPVDLFTGALASEVVDLRIRGRGIDFVWSRSYHGNIVYVGPWGLGSAWSSPYLQRLLLHPNSLDLCYVDGRGRLDHYAWIDGVDWEDAAHHYRALRHDAGAREFVMTADGDQEFVFYDFSYVQHGGRLKRIEDRLGNALTFEYTGGLLRRVIDTLGRPITLTYRCETELFDHCDPGDECGEVGPSYPALATHCTIESIRDFTGRKVKYSWYAAGDAGGAPGQLESVKAPRVAGTSTGNDFAGAGRKTTRYTYTHTRPGILLKNNLESITDPKGQTYLVNSYSATEDPLDFLFNRVVAQQYGAGGFQFHYEAVDEPVGAETATTLCIVNDRRGVVTEYRLNDRGNPVSEQVFTGFADPGLVTTTVDNRPSGPLRGTDPIYFETTAEYDTEGKPEHLTLPRGNRVELVYDAAAPERHGEDDPILVTRDVGAVGGTVPLLQTAVTYEPEHHLVETLTDPRGHTTSYFYDYQEAQLGDLNGDGVTDGALGLPVRIERPPVTVGLAAAGGDQVVVVTLEYNPFGQLVRRVDGAGEVTEYAYYPENDPDGDGEDLVPGLDPATGGYLREVRVDPGGLGLAVEFQYDRVGNPVAVTDARGHTTTVEFNQLDQVVRIQSPALDAFDADGSAVYERSFLYDANDNVVATWEELENSADDSLADTPGFDRATALEVRLEYDVLDNVTAVTREVGGLAQFPDSSVRTELEYDASENLVVTRHPNGDEDARLYDERDLLFQAVVGAADYALAASVTTLDYDPNGNLARTTHPNPANVETFAYDGFDRLAGRTRFGSSTSWSFQYDGDSNLVDFQVVGPLDGTLTLGELAHVELRYDELDRVYEVVEHLFRHWNHAGLQGGALTQALTQIEFDTDGRVVREINPNGHATTYAYDPADRLVARLDPVGNLLELVYGDGLNLTRVRSTEQNPSGGPDVFTTDQAYDELNRLRLVVDDLGNATAIDLDSRGLPARTTDAESHYRVGHFDGLGRSYRRELQVDEDVLAVLTRTWDSRSRLILEIDGLGRQTALGYDSHARLTGRINADGTARQYVWDVEDNLVELERENGERIENSYDDANRLVQRRYFAAGVGTPAIVDKFLYNGLDGLARAEEIGGHGESWARESRNLPLSCTQLIDGGGKRAFLVDFDAVGNPTSMQYPGGRTLTYGAYDALERVGTIDAGGGASVGFSYRGTDRLHSLAYGNGVDLDVTYDAVRRILDYEHSFGGQVLAGFAQTYDGSYYRRAEVFSDETSAVEHARVFDLDAYYRVVGHVDHLSTDLLGQALADFGSITPADGDHHAVIVYDDANNVTSLTLEGTAHAVSNSLMNETEEIAGLRTNIEHDVNGRLVSYVEGGTQFLLTWNLRDQLVKVEQDSGGGPVTVAEYEYYPLGMRAVKKVGSLEEHYYGPGTSVHQIYGANGMSQTLVAEFLLHGLDAPLILFRDADGNPGTGLGGLEAYYYHCNPKGDVYALTDEAGQVVERYDYSLSGATQVLDPSYVAVGASSVGNPLRFSGAFQDEETGLYWMRHRYYDPVLRGFLSRDPIEDDSLGNLYAAFENHAGEFTDPLGLGVKAGRRDNPFNICFYPPPRSPLLDTQFGQDEGEPEGDDRLAKMIELELAKIEFQQAVGALRGAGLSPLYALAEITMTLLGPKGSTKAGTKIFQFAKRGGKATIKGWLKGGKLFKRWAALYAKRYKRSVGLDDLARFTLRYARNKFKKQFVPWLTGQLKFSTVKKFLSKPGVTDKVFGWALTHAFKQVTASKAKFTKEVETEAGKRLKQQMGSGTYWLAWFFTPSSLDDALDAYKSLVEQEKALEKINRLQKELRGLDKP